MDDKQLAQIAQAIIQSPGQAISALMQQGMNPKQIVQLLGVMVQKQMMPQEQAQQLAQAVMQQTQKQTQVAKQGAKIAYLKHLKMICNPDEELTYMKAGGKVCPVCKKKQVKKEKCGGAVSEFKKKYQKGGKSDKVTPNDTIHINGQPRSLVDSNGPLTKKYKPLTNKEYQQLRDKAKKGDKEAKRKVNKQNAVQGD